MAPTDTSALDSDLQQVKNNGTKIVFVGTASNNTSLAVSRITSDNAGGGKLAAGQFAAQIGGKGTVSVITVEAGTSHRRARSGFHPGDEDEAPGRKLLPAHYDGTDSTTVAPTDIEGEITANPSLAGVFAANVITAEGAATAVRSTGKSGAAPWLWRCMPHATQPVTARTRAAVAGGVRVRGPAD